MTNYQYSYTSLQALSLALIADINKQDRKFLPVKMGETVVDVETRKNQQDIASTLTKLVLIEYVTTDLGIKTDDHLRDLVLNGDIDNADWEQYDRKILNPIADFDDNKKNEYVWVRIDDILEKLDLNFDEYLLDDEIFMKELGIKISSQKLAALGQLGDQHAKIELRFLQEMIVQQMLDNPDMFMFLLNLTPRLGKTFVVLEYVKRLSEMNNQDISLIVASKSLNSNVSFNDDKKKGGYKFKMGLVSLFKDEELFITDKKLRNEIKNITGDSAVVLVTDEADFGSHTEDAIKKLEVIKNDFDINVIHQIAMSGTGIAKASKIAMI